MTLLHVIKFRISVSLCGESTGHGVLHNCKLAKIPATDKIHYKCMYGCSFSRWLRFFVDSDDRNSIPRQCIYQNESLGHTYFRWGIPDHSIYVMKFECAPFIPKESSIKLFTLQRRHNECDSVWNHQPHGCLLNSLFRHSSKKTSKLPVAGLFAGNSPVTDEFPAQRPSNAENVFLTR